jgi:hypothetical protein
MSEHKATPEQWEVVGLCQEEGKIPWPTATCLLELRARVEALEATQHTHPELPDADPTAPAPAGSLALPGFSLDEFVLGVRRIQSALAPVVELHTRIEAARAEQAAPAPAGSLVERLRDAVYKQSGRDPTSGEMCAAIREVASALLEWHYSDGVVHTAWEAGKWLEREASNG